MRFTKVVVGALVFSGGWRQAWIARYHKVSKKTGDFREVKETGGEPGVCLMVFATEIDDFTMRSCSSGITICLVDSHAGDFSGLSETGP